MFSQSIFWLAMSPVPLTRLSFSGLQLLQWLGSCPRASLVRPPPFTWPTFGLLLTVGMIFLSTLPHRDRPRTSFPPSVTSDSPSPPQISGFPSLVYLLVGVFFVSSLVHPASYAITRVRPVSVVLFTESECTPPRNDFFVKTIYVPTFVPSRPPSRCVEGFPLCR